MTVSGTDVAHAPMTGLSHVQLSVSDVAASAAWYGAALGLEPYAEDLDAGYVALRHRAAGVVIVLTSTPAGASPSVEPSDEVSGTDGDRSEVIGNGPGVGTMDHLAFAVPHEDLLQAWARHLTDVGVKHPGIVLENGNPSLQLRDPDGVAIELVAPVRRVGAGGPTPKVT